MKKRFSLAMILSTIIASANANLSIELISGGEIVQDNPTQIQMCLNYNDYIHFNANGANGGDITWTVDHDLYADGDTFYFVPDSLGVYHIRLYDGEVINDSVDNQGAELDDEVIVDVIECIN
jgi:hypothetical protein